MANLSTWQLQHSQTSHMLAQGSQGMCFEREQQSVMWSVISIYDLPSEVTVSFLLHSVGQTSCKGLPMCKVREQTLPFDGESQPYEWPCKMGPTLIGSPLKCTICQRKCSQNDIHAEKKRWNTDMEIPVTCVFWILGVSGASLNPCPCPIGLYKLLAQSNVM